MAETLLGIETASAVDNLGSDLGGQMPETLLGIET